jgi:alpha-1,3-mannosyl-glycoprotein beta-1,2-N-acetylglucosaminyltransferase
LFFECHKAPRLIFLEEDLEVAPDFFGYFAALAPILDVDKSLLCVSAWNDHGQRGRASNATSLYRTDIFPGLGWMLTSDVGRELYEKWPNVYWDEYPRESKVRRGRQCVFPEMSRTHTFGKVGTSGGILFDEHLERMLLSKERVDWSRIVSCVGRGRPSFCCSDNMM